MLARLRELSREWCRGEVSMSLITSMSVCYILLAVGHVLAHVATTDHIAKDAFPALQDPLKAGDYNWCSFILNHLIEAVRYTQQYQPSGKDHIKLMGSRIVLQV